MRILNVVPTYLPATRYGGPIHSVHGLCAALSRLGHDVRVVTTSVDGDRDSSVAHDVPVELDGVEIWYFRSRLLRRLYYSPPMARGLERLVRDADIVHLHSVFLWPTSMAARMAARHAVPYVVSPRGMLVRDLIEQRSTFIKMAWLALIESTTLARAAAVHLTSRIELDEAQKLPLPLSNPFVVPNGVHLAGAKTGSRATSQTVRLGRDGRYILCLGRLHWKKGIDLALRALTGTDMRLVICGNDEEDHRPDLERIVRDHRLGTQVTFEDEVVGEDKWALLAQAAFVVLPSRNENFGNVVLEAMATGTAVIVSDQVGAADLVRAADAGLVCSTEVAALRETMLHLWNNPDACARLGANGARYVTCELSWERVAQQMVERYAAVIDVSRDERVAATRMREGSCSTTSRL